MINKNFIVGALASSLMVTAIPLTSFADSVPVSNPTAAVQYDNPQSRTVIVAANGKLEGQMVPYIQGLDFTGKVTLHYSAQNVGFVDGDISVLMIKLPQEFRYLGVTPDFSNAITGKLHTQTLLGDKSTDITPDMIETYSDRILIKTPHQFWVGQGHVKADVVINYGQILTQYPTLPLPDAPKGYEFQMQLKYNAAMWDIIHDPIIGSNNETYVTDESSAIVQ